MSFDNDYPNRKDRRRRYYKSKAFDRSCRNGGDCPYCEGNRTHKNKRHEPIVTEEEMAFSYMMEEDFEQQEDLSHDEYLIWLKGMIQKYPTTPFYKRRYQVESAIKDEDKDTEHLVCKDT